MTVRVIGRGEFRPSDAIDTTSRSNGWSRGLSPFYVGPIPLYTSGTSVNMENAWQFSKVYSEFVGPDGNPTPEYFAWAQQGWADSYAHRYPMGKGRKPEYSWWDSEKLDYLSARKRIYFPLYARAVAVTDVFRELLGLYRRTGSATLWDFDGYDYAAQGKSLRDVINDPTRPMGHAFVLAHLLECLA